MKPDDTSNSDDGLSFILPVSEDSPQNQVPEANNPAADLVRKKVQAAYQNEPDAATELQGALWQDSTISQSRHQKFIYELTTTGKSLPEIQTAWHEYYGGLTDLEKHQVWDEFYKVHARASRFAAVAPQAITESKQSPILPAEPATPQAVVRNRSLARRSVTDMRDYVLGGVTTKSKLKPVAHLQSLLFGLAVGAVTVLILMFGLFNERFIAPFIQPSRTVTNTPIISSDVALGAEPKIIIPKINVEIPVVYGMNSVLPSDVNTALESGVLSYANTPLPGEKGNGVIVGHSSNNIFNKGRYKFAFVLLSRLETGDTFYLEKDGKRYTYRIYQKKIVKPTDVSVLANQDKPATATLVTCDPPGTTINRLVVVGEQISPDPNGNLARQNSSNISETAFIPSNAPSIWSRLVGWLF